MMGEFRPIRWGCLVCLCAGLFGVAGVSGQSNPIVRGKVYSEQVGKKLAYDTDGLEASEKKAWEPLPGAYVVWKGTGLGTATDAHGFFKLEGVIGDTLVISFIGLRSAELPFIGQELSLIHI